MVKETNTNVHYVNCKVDKKKYEIIRITNTANQLVRWLNKLCVVKFRARPYLECHFSLKKFYIFGEYILYSFLYLTYIKSLRYIFL